MTSETEAFAARLDAVFLKLMRRFPDAIGPTLREAMVMWVMSRRDIVTESRGNSDIRKAYAEDIAKLEKSPVGKLADSILNYAWNLDTDDIDEYVIQALEKAESFLESIP